MNRIELKKILEQNKVPENLYSLNGGTPSETYCIEKKLRRWKVYYSERGQKSYIGIFETEKEACECLLNEIMMASRKIVHRKSN